MVFFYVCSSVVCNLFYSLSHVANIAGNIFTFEINPYIDFLVPIGNRSGIQASAMNIQGSTSLENVSGGGHSHWMCNAGAFDHQAFRGTTRDLVNSNWHIIRKCANITYNDIWQRTWSIGELYSRKLYCSSIQIVANYDVYI